MLYVFDVVFWQKIECTLNVYKHKLMANPHCCGEIQNIVGVVLARPHIPANIICNVPVVLAQNVRYCIDAHYSR